MRVTVYAVNVPAMSTIGYGSGLDDEGNEVRFTGDHRPMRHLGEAVAQATDDDELPRVRLEAWQILRVSPPRWGHA